MITIIDLLSYDLRVVLNNTDKQFPREDLQKFLMPEACAMIDGVHLLMCNADECYYHEEENYDNTWIRPAHINWTNLTIALMNKVDCTPEEWGNMIGDCLSALRILNRRESTMLVFKTLCLEPNEFVSEFVASMPEPDSVLL